MAGPGVLPPLSLDPAFGRSSCEHKLKGRSKSLRPLFVAWERAREAMSACSGVTLPVPVPFMGSLRGGDLVHLESIWPRLYFSVEMNNGFGLMTNWYEKPGAGWLIRLGGLMLIGISALATMTVYHHVHVTSPHGGTLLEYWLALVAFVSASAGTTMATLGQHLFDRIEVPSPWTHYYPPSFRRRRP